MQSDSPLTPTQPIRNWSCRMGTAGSSGNALLSCTGIIRNVSTGSARFDLFHVFIIQYSCFWDKLMIVCAPCRSFVQSPWVVPVITGRRTGAVISRWAWLTGASRARVKTHTAYWVTTSAPGASCARTQGSAPGTTGWTRSCWPRPAPPGSASSWIIPLALCPSTPPRRTWSWSTGSGLGSSSPCMPGSGSGPQSHCAPYRGASRPITDRTRGFRTAVLSTDVGLCWMEGLTEH